MIELWQRIRKNEVEDSESVEEEVENSSKKWSCRFDQAKKRKPFRKEDGDDAIYVDTCMATGFWIMHPM